MRNRTRFAALQSGFTLIEMIIVTLLISVAMVGLLAVFDAGARINKSEQEVADAQGSVRYGVYQMTKNIRMAGAGGLFVRQAVVSRGDSDLDGMSNDNVVYDNVPAGLTVEDTSGADHVVREGTDMIEIRGVILTPLYGLMGASCGGCTGNLNDLAIPEQVGNVVLGTHDNNETTNRPQFVVTRDYTLGVTPAHPMFVIVSENMDISGGCGDPGGAPIYGQPIYNVGLLEDPATFVGTVLTFPTLDFGDSWSEEINAPSPAAVSQNATNMTNLRRAGVMDDILYFIDDGVASANISHPQLVQAFRRGNQFDIVPIAEDVEDMQVAYGVDVDATQDGVDSGLSLTANGDEWTPNVPGETFADIPSFVDGATNCPRLHGVMISLVAKSANPDPTFRASTSLGFQNMNVPMSSGIPVPASVYPAPPAEPHYRRRVQTLRINLRNYAFAETSG